MPEDIQLALTHFFIVQVQVSQIFFNDQVIYFKYPLINMPEDAACTDPIFIECFKNLKYFFWLGQIRISNISWSTCQRYSLRWPTSLSIGSNISNIFIDRFKYFKCFLINMPEDAACTDPLFYWSVQISGHSSKMMAIV